MELFRVLILIVPLASAAAKVLDDSQVDPKVLNVSIEVAEVVPHGEPLKIVCRAKLYDIHGHYDLKHLWLHNGKMDAKIAAFFPGRPSETILNERGEVESERGPTFADHYEKTDHNLRVHTEMREEQDGRSYVLTAEYPMATCYQHTTYHCWAFAIPIPTPAETTPQHVTIHPCQEYGH